MRTKPDKITQIDLPSGNVAVDGHGYLTDPDVWTLDFAHFVAQGQGIILTA